jgi:hypothetical protein
MASTNSRPTGSGADGDRNPQPPIDDERRALWPFVAAVAIVVLALGAIAVTYVVRPADERLTEQSKVSRAINDYYTAKNAINYTNFRANTCAAELNSVDFPTEDEFTIENTDARDADGQIEIDDISETVINDNRATANIHWSRKETSDTQITQVVLVHEDNNWKVCA